MMAICVICMHIGNLGVSKWNMLYHMELKCVPIWSSWAVSSGQPNVKAMVHLIA